MLTFVMIKTGQPFLRPLSSRPIIRWGDLANIVTREETLKNPHTIRKRVGHGVPGVVVWPSWDRSNWVTLLRYPCQKTWRS